MATAPSLRQSMDFLHTWSGVVFGALLFVIFFMGTLSVFDREIDQWMLPEIRLPQPATTSLDDRVLPALASVAPDASYWIIRHPTPRKRYFELFWRDAAKGRFEARRFDPSSGQLLPAAGSWGAWNFIYPFHYSLLVRWKDLGIWIVGLAAMAMLAALVSGIIVHRKIFTDFFTFRPAASMRRGMLDLHNVCSVLFLPFHFVITLSGLIIFFSIYMPAGIQVAYNGDMDRFFDDAYQQVRRPAAGVRAPLASLDEMTREAQRRWGGGQARSVRIANPGDRNAVVQMERSSHDRVAHGMDLVYFDGPSGSVLSAPQPSAPMATYRFIAGLHLIDFERPWLRWLYFLMGLGSCFVIATGLLLWIEKRERKQLKAGQGAYRIVDATACAGCPGVMAATLVFFIANRLLPIGIENRPEIEAGFFFAAWIACAAHAWLRSAAPHGRRAWKEQTALIAALSAVAPALNWITTGDFPSRAVASDQWAVACMDIVLLACAAVAAAVAAVLYRRPAASLATADIAR